MIKKYHLETLALHGGENLSPETGARGIPIYRTSAYRFKSVSHAADLFNLKQKGNIYSRLMNPTQGLLEERMALLEEGLGALALSSGTSAIFYALINLCQAGDEIISIKNLYGGTWTMFKEILPRFGIKVKFVDHDKVEKIKDMITSKSKAIFAETISNPTLDFIDLEKISDLAKKYHLPFIVDSTFTTPALLKPIKHGANIVIHSLTKWLGGNGAALGGIVIDAGNFDWTDKKFKLFNEPEKSYHGLKFSSDLGELSPLAYILRMRLVPLRNLGACLSPDNAWIFLQGLETLSLRMAKHSENAWQVANFLEENKKVRWVRYPGLKKDPSFPLASLYLKQGFGGVVTFGLKGGYEAAVKLINKIKLFSHVANVGDSKSLILHPASTSHAQLSARDKKRSGITLDLIRLSLGIENISDLLEALQTGLKKIF